MAKAMSWGMWACFPLGLGAAGCAVDARDVAVSSDGASSAPSDQASSLLPEGTPGPGTDAASGEGTEAAAADARPTFPTPEDPCEGLPLSRCECVVGEQTTCGAEYASIGACGARVLECQPPGIWPPGTECTALSAELCDPGQIDDDCDGSVDEGCTCINTTSEACGVGQGGIRVCAQGDWAPCVCEPELLLDIDQNGVPDASETLLVNGTFTADLAGWLQSQRNNIEFDGILFELDSTDATGLQCSGSMLLISTENAGNNFAEQCVTASAGVYVAIAQALLVGNSGGGRASTLEVTGVDAAVVTLELTAFDASNCQGTPSANQVTRLEMVPGDPWQTLRTTLTAPATVQSLSVRANVVADDEQGLQFYANRTVRWDNLALRPL